MNRMTAAVRIATPKTSNLTFLLSLLAVGMRKRQIAAIPIPTMETN